MASIGDYLMGVNEAAGRIEKARKAGKALTGRDFGPKAMREGLKMLTRRNREGSMADSELARRKKLGYQGN